MRVNIANIVRNIGKNIKFLQPLYESIVNSLEANATKIEIKIDHDAPGWDITPKMIGFSITDNGEGFNQKNRDAFMELWTNNKISLGCKGSGRFTWLRVYERINIESRVATENKRIVIPFSMNFEEGQMETEIDEPVENITTITFSDVTPQYFNNSRDKRSNVDHRCLADIDEIVKSIEEYLLIKLFLLKKAGRQFNIKIILDKKSKEITNDSIPELDNCQFEIKSDITNENYQFQLFYRFMADNLNSKKMYLCANGRTILELDDDSLGFSAQLPNKDSFIMLLCSKYLDGKDNDGRNELSELAGKKQADIDIPLLVSDIKQKAKEYMHKIIIEKYPELISLNKKEEAKAINKAPYLANIIRKNKDVLKSERSLLKEAKKEFELEKEEATNKFEKLLKDRNIDTKEYNKAISELSSIAVAELGEYIFYREYIINALKIAIEQNNDIEQYYHNIFMPMKTYSNYEDKDKHLLSNIWLLDDKFMTYSYAASDRTIKQIKDEIEKKNNIQFKIAKRPDLSIFFNKNNGRKNIVMVEFKSPKAELYEKTKAFTELTNDINIIKRNIPDIDTVWSYIITTIDEEFEFSIETSESYTQLFSTEEASKAYYRYLPKANAHTYIIDLRTIISDASDRNKTFLDILKKVAKD